MPSGQSVHRVWIHSGQAALMIMLMAAAGLARAGEAPAQPDQGPAAAIKALDAACAASADVRAARQAARPLYHRLGGFEGIHRLMREVVRRHQVNPDIQEYFAGVDAEALARRSALFLAAGSGGEEVYEGPDLTTVHVGMGLDEADFLAAGKDMEAAMASLGHGAGETEEVMCALAGLRDQVILPKDR